MGENVEERKRWVDIPSPGSSILEDLIRDTGHDTRDRDKKVDQKRRTTRVGKEGGDKERERGLDMSPEDQKHNQDQGWGSQDQLRTDGKTGQTEEETEDQLHGHKLDVMGRVVREGLETVL